MISIPKAELAFAEYVRKYNPEDGKVRLKIVHTYHVAETARRIAEEMRLSREDVLLAQLIGILHDIGRFEQIRRFNDFRDHLTVNHAELGADLLENGLLREFVADPALDRLILSSVRMHNRFSLPEIPDARTRLHCRLIRDADKTDIFRVRVTDPIEDIQAFGKEDIENSEVTPAAFDTFMSHACLNRENVKTPADSWIAGTAMIFDFNYLPGLRILHEEKYVDRMIGRLSYRNQETAAKMEKIRECADAYIESRLVAEQPS